MVNMAQVFPSDYLHASYFKEWCYWHTSNFLLKPLLFSFTNLLVIEKLLHTHIQCKMEFEEHTYSCRFILSIFKSLMNTISCGKIVYTN